ncbi:hypothetical protein TNCV_2868371 [Trichonephila clavipes]|nr:hypothetical protein TNCV_2868371 [Trichonephila clavipes]
MIPRCDTKNETKFEKKAELATTVLMTSSHTPPQSMWPVLPLLIMQVGRTVSFSEHVQLHSARKINTKFLVKLKKSVTKTFQILTETYGESFSRTHVTDWYNRLSGKKKQSRI